MIFKKLPTDNKPGLRTIHVYLLVLFYFNSLDVDFLLIETQLLTNFLKLSA